MNSRSQQTSCLLINIFYRNVINQKYNLTPEMKYKNFINKLVISKRVLRKTIKIFVYFHFNR